MRWLLLIAGFGLSITDVASHAQGLPAGQRPTRTQPTTERAGFFSEGVVRFQLIQGRLCLHAPKHEPGNHVNDRDCLYESLSVTAERGIPSMHYVCKTPSHHLTLSVQQAKSVRIESWFPETAERAVLEQPVAGPIAWTVRRDQSTVEHAGSTLLHIRQADPASFDAHYGKLIERLLRGQSLRALTSATRRTLLRRVHSASLPDRDSIHDCIRELSSTSRAKRIAAQRQLLTWGTPIIPVIQSLQAEDLDAEQANRLTHILKLLRPPICDTASTLAMLLINDREFWEGISSELTRDQRATASKHLVRFDSRPLAIPSAADQRIARADD